MTNIISSAPPAPTLAQTDRAKAAAEAAKQLKQLKQLNRDMKDDAHEAASQKLQGLLAQLHSMVALGSKGSAAYTALARKIASSANALVRTGEAVPSEAKTVDNQAQAGAKTGAKPVAIDVKIGGSNSAKDADRELLRAARTGLGLVKAAIAQEEDDKRRRGLLTQIGNADRAVAMAQAKIGPTLSVGPGVDIII